MPRSAIYDLEGRCAVITGGARGIGWATAQRLLRSGARVAIWDIDEAAIAERLWESGGMWSDRLAGFPVDVSSSASVQAAARDTRAALGVVSVLVNNAVVVDREASCLLTSEAQWTRMLDVNVVGAVRCFQSLVPDMVTAGYGRVVNMGSVSGKYGTEMLSAYGATKAALINFTRTAARELAETGVLVNAVAPGGTWTDGMARMSIEQRERIERSVPMRRMAKPEEIAALVAWLCSDECSFCTGATFDVAGGRSFS